MGNERASELEYLRWFFATTDFGPADGDVRFCMEQEFENETGTLVPEGYRLQDEED